VAQKLKALGFIGVRPLRGGFYAWKSLGYPLVESSSIAWRTVALPESPEELDPAS
jgi:3-mercaptopyruvate sulfurtransferase SseA